MAYFAVNIKKKNKYQPEFYYGQIGETIVGSDENRERLQS